jgi:hypothetical protein
MSTTIISRSSRSLLGGLLAGALALWPLVGMAHSDGPFSKFSGNWRGAGQVVGADGHREPIRCRAGYSLSQSGEALTQALVCASDSYRVNISSQVVAEGHRVQGHWQEATRQVQGDLSGQVVEGQFEGSVIGPGFTAQVSLRSNGRKQVVNIRPNGGDIAAVEVVLSR